MCFPGNSPISTPGRVERSGTLDNVERPWVEVGRWPAAKLCHPGGQLGAACTKEGVLGPTYVGCFEGSQLHISPLF